MRTQNLVRAAGILLVAVLLSGWACNQAAIAERAEEAIAAAKGVIEEAQDRYEATCQADPSQPPCTTINKAVDFQNAAIDALNLYCAGPGWAEGGECNPPSDAEARDHLESRLKEYLAELDTIIEDLEALLQ